MKPNLNNTASHPLQTQSWADFRREWGNEILETKYGIITLHRIPLTGFKIGVFEKGPMPSQNMLADLKKIGQGNNLIFIKLEPSFAKATEGQAKFDRAINLLQKSGCVRGRRLFTPTTFWVDLAKSEEELLKSFHSKTRYNIRLAQKQGVIVKEDNSDESFEKYLELTFETAKRQGFYAHTKRYHRLMWQYLRKIPNLQNSKTPIAHLLTAVYKGRVVATWILFVWKDFLYYPYGASTDKYKNVMANNLMMWEAIRFGKKLGLKTFDLWGREEGKGFTRFKEGYNPKVVELVGSWDMVINKPLYYLYRAAEKIRWAALRIKSKFLIPNF